MNWKRMIKGSFLILVHFGLSALAFWFVMYHSESEILKIIFVALGCFYLLNEFVHGFVQEYPFNPFKEPSHVVVKLNGKKEVVK
jgi:hypothetical protein